MEENVKRINVKKERIKIAVFVVSILLIVSSVSYAFFAAGVSTPASTDVNIGSEVSESLSFTPGTPINLTANLNNFAEGDGSLSGETITSANIKASSSVGSASQNYYVYYNVTSNNFVYTVDNNTPELILTITDPEGNVLQDLTNHPELEYKTVTDAVIGNVSGFDVTEYEGLILIDDNYTISTTDSVSGTTQEWKAKLTFINLDTIQTLNEGKVFESQLILQAMEFNYATATLSKMGYSAAKIAEINSNPEPDFSQVATENEGIFAAQDDYGTSYYFRGAVDNNWVEFAGFYWRIIRINGDGSIRMIYSGSTQPDESQKVVMTGNGTQIGTSAFNTTYSSAEYVGYMYTVGQQHGLTTDSTIKTVIDTWYETNILNTKYHRMLSDTLFCGDRTAYIDTAGTTEASGTGTTTQYFGNYIRNYNNQTPSLMCPVKEDSYTVDDEVNGNGALDYPVALITADEVSYAGGLRLITNSNFYLSTVSDYWLGSPYSFGSSYAFGGVFVLNSLGEMRSYNVSYSNGSGARPLVSLKSDALASGSGQWNDPYVVE